MQLNLSLCPLWRGSPSLLKIQLSYATKEHELKFSHSYTEKNSIHKTYSQILEILKIRPFTDDELDMNNLNLEKRLAFFDKRTYYYPKFKYLLKYKSSGNTIIETAHGEHIFKPKVVILENNKDLQYVNFFGRHQTIKISSIKDLIPSLTVKSDQERRSIVIGKLVVIFENYQQKVIFSATSNPLLYDFTVELQFNEELLRIRDLILGIR